MSDYEKSAFTLRYLIYYARVLEIDDRIFRIKQKTRKRTEAFQCFEIIEDYRHRTTVSDKSFTKEKFC